jgi:hypothetical protein
MGEEMTAGDEKEEITYLLSEIANARKSCKSHIYIDTKISGENIRHLTQKGFGVEVLHPAKGFFYLISWENNDSI